MKKKIVFILFIPLFFSFTQTQSERFFYSGDGRLNVKGSQKKLENISPRLVALLDYLQDRFSPGDGKIEIYSGYRSPQQNERLRKKGRLAAKASLHMEGMAIDFVLEGVDSKKLWAFIRDLNCCGASYYHGRAIHLDTGPARFWDEKTSKVFTDIASHNKQIYLNTDYDIYQRGESLGFRFVRMTYYPFGVKNKFEIVSDEKKIKMIKVKTLADCQMIHSREEAHDRSLLLPKNLPAGRKLKIKASFCEKPSEEMPDFILSNAFMIK